MFHDIPREMMDRMRELERRDALDQEDGTPRSQRLRQIPPQTGKFLALLAANVPSGCWLEIGASAGYSALWLALACRATGNRLTTFEVLEEKVILTQTTFELAGVSDLIELIRGDARDYLPHYQDIAFCFLDAEKEIYSDCYEVVVPHLVSGGLLLADNAINHQSALQVVLDRALQDARVDALIVPIGKGVLVCRKQ
jgi:caffeoyl-CoA O-methyltransferase